MRLANSAERAASTAVAPQHRGAIIRGMHRRDAGGSARRRHAVVTGTLLAAASACVSNETENIDVREQAMLYAGRVQVHPPQIQEEARRKGVGRGADVGFQ